LPLDAEMHDIYTRATGNSVYNAHEHREAVAICGRRSGKDSRLAANTAVIEALFREHKLATGERGYVVVIAPTKKQASVAFQYISARLENSPSMRAMISGEPHDNEVDLVNGITISVLAANQRTARGFSIVCCIFDEEAFFFDDATNANPASEILKAIRPGMSGCPTAKLVRISSPFAKVGNLWESWRDRARHPEVLTWKLDTRTMNPSIDRAFLDAEEARDPESFAREYDGQFYESTSAFLPADAVEACVVRDRIELPPQQGVQYWSALDVAFKGDFFAFCIVNRVGSKVVQSFIRSWKGSRSSPVNLAQVLSEIVSTLRSYHCWKIHGDSVCSEPVRQALASQGVEFVQATTLGTRAAPIWSTLRTLVTSREMELLDDAQTITELKRLELVVTSGGNQRVEASSGHDDRAVVLALSSHQAVAQQVTRKPFIETIRTPMWGGGLRVQ
jgi:phage terminase large subunit-like protein